MAIKFQQLLFLVTQFLILPYICHATPHVNAENELLSHRVIYDLELKHAESSSDIAAVDGRMVLEWLEGCIGYSTNQVIKMRIQRGNGPPIFSDFSVVSWEERSGNTFRFLIRNIINGQLIEEYDGRAGYTMVGYPGLIQMMKPIQADIPLPSGTVFPSQHSDGLIRQAKKGANRIEMRVFDGTGESGIFDAIAFVTGHQRAGEVRTGIDQLDIEQSWQMRMSYFKFKDLGGIPNYEVGFRLFANGVIDQLVLDHGDFEVASNLVHFEPLKTPEC